MEILSKLKSWFLKIPFTIILIVIIGILVLVLRVPLLGFIRSIQQSLRGAIDDHVSHAATQVAEENNSVIPEAPKNYQKIAAESQDNTVKVLASLDQTLEMLKNVKTTP